MSLLAQIETQYRYHLFLGMTHHLPFRLLGQMKRSQKSNLTSKNSKHENLLSKMSVQKATLTQACLRIILFAAYAVAFSSLLTLCKFIFYILYLQYSGFLSDANFYPLNGKFQAFNPIRRLLAGQSPGPDFVSYTGSGPMLLTLVAMIISDCRSFTCSVFWGNLLSGLASVLFFSWISFLCLVGSQVPLARWFRVFLALVLGLIITVPLATGYAELDLYFTNISQLNVIGNSQLGLRAANATICSIFVFIISLCESSRKRAALRWHLFVSPYSGATITGFFGP